jgi:hypothetical protein
MKIKSEYAIVEAPSNYYKDGGENVGYYGDEAYAFGIQWLRQDGSYTNVYHIPGTTIGSGTTLSSEQFEADVFESNSDCKPDGLPPAWYVQNTAAVTGAPNTDLGCGLRLIRTGQWRIQPLKILSTLLMMICFLLINVHLYAIINFLLKQLNQDIKYQDQEEDQT